MEIKIFFFLGESIQHPFKLHITLVTKLTIDGANRRLQGPSPVLQGSIKGGTLTSTNHYIYGQLGNQCYMQFKGMLYTELLELISSKHQKLNTAIPASDGVFK